MTFQRTHLQRLESRMREKRRFIQVLAGPRQVGKTTLAQQLMQQLGDIPTYYTAADAVANAGITWIEQQWETARLTLQQSGAPELVLVIDEVQKIANWSEIVKRLWDEDTRLARPIKVVLLGSSRLLLQQGLTESLAGRFELSYVGHWSLSEMQEAFGWTPEQFAWFGGFPGAADLIADEPRWKQYVTDALIETSISKDILMLTRVDKPALMRNLFELGCAYSGQLLSYNKILGQLQDAGNTTTLATYLGLLGQAGLLSGLDKYTGNRITQRGSSPKFQVHNTALLSAQSADSFSTIRLQPDKWGRLVESTVGAYLINEGLADDFRVLYWREGGHEIDFVLEKRGKIIGLEVKSGPGPAKTSGMAAFQKNFRPDRVLLVGDGGLPWPEFLRIRPNELF
ncbi:MAG: ATP-binding protein [Saprospiraceae bacterium]|nr:ATP-binding protein [Saprospiraceae bacterium]